MPKNPIGYALFNAINDNDRVAFKTILGKDPLPDWLLLTDHCDDRLELELGGVGSLKNLFSGYDNNTLLHFALCMERLDIAKELIVLHKHFNQKNLFLQTNESGITPLEMLCVVHGDFVKKFSSAGRLDSLKIHSELEKQTIINSAIDLLAELTPYYPNHKLFDLLQNDLAFLVLPKISLALLKLAVSPAVLPESQQAFELLSPEAYPSAYGYIQSPAHSSGLPEELSRQVQMVIGAYLCKLQETKQASGPISFRPLFLRYEQMVLTERNPLAEISEFLILLKKQRRLPNLAFELERALSSPSVLNDSTSDKTPLIFSIINAFQQINAQEAKLALARTLILLITPEMHNLADENQTTVLGFMKSDAFGQAFRNDCTLDLKRVVPRH